MLRALSPVIEFRSRNQNKVYVHILSTIRVMYHAGLAPGQRAIQFKFSVT